MVSTPCKVLVQEKNKLGNAEFKAVRVPRRATRLEAGLPIGEIVTAVVAAESEL